MLTIPLLLTVDIISFVMALRTPCFLSESVWEILLKDCFNLLALLVFNYSLSNPLVVHKLSNKMVTIWIHLLTLPMSHSIESFSFVESSRLKLSPLFYHNSSLFFHHHLILNLILNLLPQLYFRLFLKSSLFLFLFYRFAFSKYMHVCAIIITEQFIKAV